MTQGGRKDPVTEGRPKDASVQGSQEMVRGRGFEPLNPYGTGS